MDSEVELMWENTGYRLDAMKIIAKILEMSSVTHLVYTWAILATKEITTVLICST
jgi:hypothetical protein